MKPNHRTDYASCDFTSDGDLLVGTRKGKIYKLCQDSRTYKFNKSMAGHKKTVNCITVLNQIFLSGGNDKKIIIWNLAKLKKIKMIDVEAHVRSVDYLGNTLLYSTSTGTIIKKEVKLKNFEKFESSGEDDVVMKSHNDGEAWGVAIHKHHIYTCGDDNQLIVWNMRRREVEAVHTLWTKQMEKKDGVKQRIKRSQTHKRNTASSTSSKKPHQQARAIAINTRENHVAVAFNDCKIVIKHLFNLDEHLHVIYDPKEWCEILEYNPSQTRLAAGSHDNNIYVYDISDHGYAMLCVLKAHNSYISALDWSSDGDYIRSNCGAYELLFFDVNEKEQDKSGASNLKNTEWHTQNCKLAWNVQGIYPHGTDGTHINGVASLKSKNILATGDDYGLVNLYNDPCEEKFNKARSYRGHSEHVVRVKFADEGKYIISIGGYDQTILQWKLEGEDTDEDLEDQIEEEEEAKIQQQEGMDYEKYTESDTNSDDEEAVGETKNKKSKKAKKDKVIEEEKEEEEETDKKSKKSSARKDTPKSKEKSRNEIKLASEGDKSGLTNELNPIKDIQDKDLDNSGDAIPFNADIKPIDKTESSKNL